MSKVLKEVRYPYGIIELREDKVVVRLTSYTTELQKKDIIAEAIVYATHGTKPMKVCVSDPNKCS